MWQTFSKIVEWVSGKFVSYNGALKTLNWWLIYQDYIEGKFNGNLISKNATEINEEVIRLASDDEVIASMKGIYLYIIFGDGKYLQIRQFDEKHQGQFMKNKNITVLTALEKETIVSMPTLKFMRIILNHGLKVVKLKKAIVKCFVLHIMKVKEISGKSKNNCSFFVKKFKYLGTNLDTILKK